MKPLLPPVFAPLQQREREAAGRGWDQRSASSRPASGPGGAGRFGSARGTSRRIRDWPMATEERGWDAKRGITRANIGARAVSPPNRGTPSVASRRARLPSAAPVRDDASTHQHPRHPVPVPAKLCDAAPGLRRSRCFPRSPPVPGTSLAGVTGL